MPDSDVERRLRMLNMIALAGATALILFVVLCITVLVYLAISVNSSSNEVKDLAENNQATLCALRGDIERRRDDTVDYLKTHPRGVVSPVTHAVIITPAELQRSIDGQTSTLVALDRHLNCKENP